jgi:hypothetical protein
MSRIKRLIQSYGKFIAIPWRDVAPAQRVVFCVYGEQDELRVRARIQEMELVTKEHGHRWALFDVTNTFAEWLTGQRYAKSYFEKPRLLRPLLPKYLDFVVQTFRYEMSHKYSDENAVVALMGIGSLFGLIKVKELVDRLAPLVKGKLLILFPGSYDNNNYRLLDGYDGWNYLAIPITGDKD